MTHGRIQQALVFGALTLGIAVVLLQALFRPSPDERMVEDITSYREESTRWQGKFPPDFSLRLRNGESFRLAEHIGREVIILNFFTTWCGPCKAEMPELNGFVLKHRGAPLVLVGINVDEKPDKVDAFCRELALAFPVGIDTNGAIAAQYGVRSYPTTVLIGADGRVGLFQIGGIANADVVFGSLLAPQLEAIRRGRGIDRPAYEAGVTNQASLLRKGRTGASKAKEPEINLDAPARAFAGRMRCPSCGDSLAACGCGLCDSVKKRLATISVTNRTDEQVLHALFLEEKAP